MPSFKEVYDLLRKRGGALIISRRGAEYSVEARDDMIVAILTNGKGRIYVHEDCWLEKVTCKGTWASGLYQGNPSLLDWYEANI
ncbi:MAG: hypothetical protein WC282_03290 [Bacilli bacterium]|jgi:hypothetical protein